MNRMVRGMICTLLGGCFWGFSGACSQYLFTNYQIASGWLTVIRMLGAGVILTAVSLAGQRRAALEVWKTKGDRVTLALFAVFGLMFSQYSYLTAISHSNAGTATVLQYLGPVMIMVLVCVANRKLPDRREGLAVILAVLGTFLLATHGDPSSMVLSAQGLVWGLLAAVSLACYTLIPSKIIPRWGSMIVTGYGMLLGGIVLGVILQVWKIPVALDAKGLLALAGVVIVGTLLAYTMYLQGVADIGPVKASMLASVEPVSATVFSVVWLKSAFAWMDLAGFVCIMATVFLLTVNKKEERDAQGSSD